MEKYKLYIAPYISPLFKLLVGLIFIMSAILKCNSIDNFELYIFSFNIFSLSMSALAARLVIGAELIMGVGYIINIYHRGFFYAILMSLIGFTLLLLYLTYLGSEDNCHCFGDLVDMSPMESIVKNVAIIAMLYLSRNVSKWRFDTVKFMDFSVVEHYKRYILLLVCMLIMVPFVRYPHHTIYAGKSAGVKDVSSRVNIELFNSFIESNPQLGWGEQCKILAFYGTHCKYCRLSAKMISQIIRRNDLSTDAIHLLFWGSEERVATFFKEANAVEFDYSIINPKVLLKITNGEIPTILFYDETREYKFRILNIRTMEESDIIERLGENL